LTPLKQKLQNQIMYLISFQYFVHPPGVTSTARYRVLIDTMCLWIGMDMKKNWLNEVISIHHRSYVSLNGYTWSFHVPENAQAHSVILIFAMLNVFHNRQSTSNTFLPNSTTTLPCKRSPNS